MNMKSATEWLNQVGEVVMFSAFAGGDPPGIEVEKLVKQIQADALRHASNFCHNASPNAPHSYIRDEILAAAKALEA